MIKKVVYVFAMILSVVFITACSGRNNDNSGNGVDFEKLNMTKEWDLSYATKFAVKEYEEYAMISIEKDDFLLVPEGKAVPKNVPKKVTILKQPLSNTYMVSSSSMDMIREIGALSKIKYTGTKKSDWYIDEVINALEAGDMVYAGKYSAPDYELILSGDCKFVVENTMITHNPEVKEKLEELGIPVLIEYSSYEEHPLGRLEWVKLYGLLFDKKDEANEFYENEVKRLLPILTKEKTDVTIAFFYVTSNGSVNVRKPNDYISKMIELAGGNYIFNEILNMEENSLSTTNMQMEDFYSVAKNADVLIYNSTIDGEIEAIDQLIAKSELFKDFKAVENKNVYCTSSNFFQETTGTCKFIEDLNKVILSSDKGENSSDTEGFCYLKSLK